MIVTLTANPSTDRTAPLPAPLQRGGVHRLGESTQQPGGKGVNVAQAVRLAGERALAVVPADEHDTFTALLRETGLEHVLVPVGHPVRTNLTLAEPDGTTTKLNEAGARWDDATASAVRRAVLEAAGAPDARWVVLAGSLPPGAPASFYADLTRDLRALDVRVAVDSSGAPLRASVETPGAAPDLVKPNAEELAELTGLEAAGLEERAAAGDTEPLVGAARQLVDRGVGAVLATLGAAGALLVTADGVWRATPPPTTPRSTVGAGDSSLAGYLLAHTRGGDPADCLRHAVAYGSAAASLPGTTIPRPDQIDLDRTAVTPAGPGTVPADGSTPRTKEMP